MAKTKKSEIASRFLVPSVGRDGQGSTLSDISLSPPLFLSSVNTCSDFGGAKKFSVKCFLPLGRFEKEVADIRWRLNAE